MYIKLVFQFIPWVVPQCAGGVQAVLKNKPEIIPELPEGVQANQPCEQLKTLLQKQRIQESFYCDCGMLSQAQIEEALINFNQFYNNYNSGFPGTNLPGNTPEQNEIICNLKIALENILNKEETPFLSINSMGNGERLTFSS